MSFSDAVQCDMCKGERLRGETLLVDTPKGRYRLCRDCFAAYESKKLNQGYKTAKENIKLYGIKGTDAYEIIKKQENFIKDIKKGALYVKPQNKH